MKLYEVRSPGGCVRLVWVKDSTQAKRIFCRLTGRKATDPWTGVSALTARQVKDLRLLDNGFERGEKSENRRSQLQRKSLTFRHPFGKGFPGRTGTLG